MHEAAKDGDAGCRGPCHLRQGTEGGVWAEEGTLGAEAWSPKGGLDWRQGAADGRKFGQEEGQGLDQTVIQIPAVP